MNFQDKTHVFYLMISLALVLVRMPVIGKAFKVFYTMVHELGHAIMTVITRGEIISISLFSDTSGTTITKSKGKTGQFLVALAGYPFAAAMAFLFLYLLTKGKTTVVMFIFATIALTELVFWIRNLYGILWLIAFLLLVFLAYWSEKEIYCFGLTVFFSAILVFESLISSVHLVIISIKNPLNAGDAGNLKKVSLIPAIFWALLFLSFSVVLIYFCFKLFPSLL